MILFVVAVTWLWSCVAFSKTLRELDYSQKESLAPSTFALSICANDLPRSASGFSEPVRHVRFGSKADIRPKKPDVRFVPKAVISH